MPDATRIEGKMFQHTHVEFVLDDDIKKAVIDSIKQKGKVKIILTGIDLEKGNAPGAVLVVGVGPCD